MDNEGLIDLKSAGGLGVGGGGRNFDDLGQGPKWGWYVHMSDTDYLRLRLIGPHHGSRGLHNAFIGSKCSQEGEYMDVYGCRADSMMKWKKHIALQLSWEALAKATLKP